MRAITVSTGTPERLAISANGSRTKPSILSSETARIFALIGSLCSTGNIAAQKETRPTRSWLQRSGPGRSGRAGKDRTEMAGRAGQDKKVPDKVVVADVLVDEKENARGVGDASGKKPENGVWRHRLHERPQGDQDQPAHPEVKSEREPFPF